jgi:hypothetical protein
MRKRRLEEIYNDYAAKVLPPQAGAVQRKETRQAFFAGAVSAMGLLQQAADDELQALHICQDLEAEVNAFAEATAKAGSGEQQCVTP